MATSEEKRPKVHGQKSTPSKYDLHQETATALHNPQLMSHGSGPSVVFPQNTYSLSTSKPFSQSVTDPRFSSQSTRESFSSTIGGTRSKILSVINPRFSSQSTRESFSSTIGGTRSKILSVINPRLSSQSTRESFYSTVGGTRPKMLSMTPEASKYTSLPDATQNNTGYDSKSDKESVCDYDRDNHISINIRFEVYGIKKVIKTSEIFDFGRNNAMKWKYITSLASGIFECNEYLRKKYAEKTPTSLYRTIEDLPVPSGNVCLTKDSVLFIGFSVNNTEHARQIAKELLRWIFDEMELMVETVDIKKNEIEEVVTEIKKTSPKNVFVEAVQTKVYVVFQTSSRDQIERNLCKYRVEELREERIPVKRIFSKFTVNIKHSLIAKYSKLYVQFVERDDSLICILRGPQESVTSGIDMLRHLSKGNRVNFTTDVNLALRKLFVEKQVNDLLSREHPECIAEQEGNEIYIYGLADDTVRSKACLFVGQMIIECEPIPLLGNLRQKKNDLVKHFQTKFTSKLVAIVDCSFRLHLIGFKEAVNEAIQELVEMIEGRSSITARRMSKEPERKEIRNYAVRKKVHFFFMEKSTLLKSLEKKFDVEMNVHRKQYEIEVRGASRNVQQACEHFASIENDIRSEGATLLNQQAVRYFQGELSKEYLDTVGLKFDVLIEKEVLFDFNKVKIMKHYFEESIKWSDAHGRKLIVERNNVDEVQASTKAVAVSFDPRGKRFTRKGNIVTMGVPSWIDGNHGEESDLASIVVTLLTKAADEKEKYVAIPVAPFEKWPFDQFVRCIVKSCVHWLLDWSDVAPSSVLLFTDHEDYFQRTDTYIEECVKNYMKEFRNRPKAPEIRLLKAQLDLTEADVLVNTTAPNLDLSYGKVSAAVSNAAGPELQQECKAKYSKGISQDMIAVTGGYKLMCKHVFHITLPRFTGNVAECIESIRKIMMMCLTTASDYGHATIAFPVIGTGTLFYPVDIVVSEMFGAVERHRTDCPDTKLKEVRFVIFPKDTETLKIFKKQEDKLRSVVAEHPQTTEPRYEVTFKLTGMKRNVSDAKAELESKGKALSMPVNREITKTISNVTSLEYEVITELYRYEFLYLNEEGLKISHSSRKREVIVTGMENLFATALLTLNRYVQYVKDMQTFEIPIKTEEEQKLNMILRESSINQDVVCVYNRPASRIVVFAKRKELLEKAARNLESKLKSMGKNIRQDEAMDTSDDRQFPTNKGARSCLNKPTFKRSFSWSKDANNVNIYENGNLVIKVYEANALLVPVEGIVIAVNQDLHPRGAIANEIARNAGEEYTRAYRNTVGENKGPLKESAVVCTTAGNLDFKNVIHAVCPVWSGYKPMTKENLHLFLKNLEHTITNCLMTAESRTLKSIVISGISGVPSDVCAVQYARSILEFSNKKATLYEIHVVDKDHSLIEIVHKTFATIITERKPAPYPLSVYVERSTEPVKSTDERSANTNVDERKKIKFTGRDKPKPRPNHNEDQPDFMKENLLYKSGDEKLIYSFGSPSEVHVYLGDISQLDGISAIVCSETTNGDSKGEMSRTLLNNGGLEYRRNKETQFTSQRKLGELITTEGGRNKFTWVIHAIISRTEIKVLADVYRKIFQEVRTRELSSLALPLLGAGDFGLVDSTKTMFCEWFQFCRKNTVPGFKLYLVIEDASNAEKVEDVWKRCIAEMKPDSSSNEKVAAMEDCVICMDKVTDAKILKCGHTFCRECIDVYLRVKKVCPTCGKVCGIITGDQPDGTMTITKISEHITGFESHKSISISYCFRHGTQGPGHPKPGAFYKGIARTAYLPDNREGREICAMLKVAFERRLVFTIGSSRTTGQEGVITWNDIHHKTDMRPNTQFCHPDQTYLQRVREELEVKGVTIEDVDKKFLKKLEQNYFRHTVD